MKKILSYSLFQTASKDKFYIRSLLAQKEIIEELFPGFIVHIYHDITIDNEIIDIFRKWGWVTKQMPVSCNMSGLSWRFIPIFEDDVGILYVQDVDTVITYTQKEATRIFETSDKLLYCRYSYTKTYPISAGHFGIKRKGMEIIKNNVTKSQLFETFDYDVPYYYDEYWLKEYIYKYLEEYSFHWTANVEAQKTTDIPLVYVKPVKPPLDSSIIRHNLVECNRYFEDMYDNILSYYTNEEPIKIERITNTEDWLKNKINIRERNL